MSVFVYEPEVQRLVVPAIVGPDGKEHAYYLFQPAHRAVVYVRCGRCAEDLDVVGLSAKSTVEVVAAIEQVMSDHVWPRISWRAAEHGVGA